MGVNEDFESKINDLDRKLRPIANRPVDITKPGWAAHLKERPHPFDEAGVRHDANLLLEEMMKYYAGAGPEAREAIRKLFTEYKAFSWAASLSFSPTTEDTFRCHLILFSIKDQGTDSRDALIWLQDLCRTASAAGVNTASILKEVADLSSDRNKYGMGSTKKMLLDRAA